MLEMYDHGKGPFIKIEGKIIFITLDQIEQINLGYQEKLVNGKLVLEETVEYKKQNIQNQINQTNQAFDTQIEKFLSDYPKEEIKAFDKKEREAKVVIEGGSSIYIESKAKLLGITPTQFAEKILQKSEEFTKLYTDLENKKDLKIKDLEQQLLELNEE